MPNPYSLEGKKAFVTGAKRNIGRGIAMALADMGADVGINDLEQDDDALETLRLVREMGRQSEFLAGDISDSARVEAMFAEFLERFGRIDILVNNPCTGGGHTFLEITEENWDRHHEVGVKGFYLCSQQAARAMVAQGDGGCIVSTSSVHGARAWKADAAYGASKAGILRLTESMAVDLGEYGIRCNAILPGHMNTGHVFGSPPPAYGSIGEGLSSAVPLRRRGTPEDIGRAVAFLCSPGAACIIGVCLPVEGGVLVAAPGMG